MFLFLGNWWDENWEFWREFGSSRREEKRREDMTFIYGKCLWEIVRVYKDTNRNTRAKVVKNFCQAQSSSPIPDETIIHWKKIPLVKREGMKNE